MHGNNLHAYAYKETKVKTASQGQIIVMLYDAALRNMDAAADSLDRGDKRLDTVNASLTKTRDIVTELICSLDMENGGPFAERMFSLYMWFNQQLLEANLNKDAGKVRAVRAMMADLREAWAQIVGCTNVEGRAMTGVNLAG
jgi:flagellar protein FliS